MMRMARVASSLGYLAWERPQQLLGALPLALIQLSDPDGELEVIWLKEGTIFGPISKEGEQWANVTVSCPSCHHDECSDHDRVSGFERHKNKTLIAIVIWIWIGGGVQHGNFGLCDHEQLACDCGPGDHIDHKNSFESDNDCVWCGGYHDHKRACLEND